MPRVKKVNLFEHPIPLKSGATSPPILAADDFTTGKYAEHVRDEQLNVIKTKHCLAGWHMAVFAGSSELSSKNLVDSANALGYVQKENVPDCIVDLNDKTLKTNEQRANTWNLFVARLGFAEGNPMAQYVKKPRRTKSGKGKAD